jgi:hypothetical protein
MVETSVPAVILQQDIGVEVGVGVELVCRRHAAGFDVGQGRGEALRIARDERPVGGSRFLRRAHRAVPVS